MNEKVEALARVPLFERCSKHELEFIAGRMDELDYPAGSQLTRQGVPGGAFFVLTDGEVKVDVGGSERGRLHAGDFFGEISMIDRGPATATVTAATPVSVMVMSHAQFRDAVRSDDAIFEKVMGAMTARLRRDAEEPRA